MIKDREVLNELEYQSEILKGINEKVNIMRKDLRVFLVCLLLALGIKFAFGQQYRVDPLLEPYLEEFVEVASEQGIDLSYIYDSRITIIFTKAENKRNRVAVSYGRNKDNITVLVYRDRFEKRTEEGRKYVMFHEFGHDILDLPHGETGMMRPTAYSGFFRYYSETSPQVRQELYLYRSLRQMFIDYKIDNKITNKNK